MGLRYVHVEPLVRGEGFVELRLDENHRPPVYLATVRIFAERPAAPDTEHVREVAAPVLKTLACRDVAHYLEKAHVLERAKRALLGPERPERFEEGDIAFERAREVVTVALQPRERDVYRVLWRGEHALSYWFAERPGAELYWASSLFRVDPRVKPRALEHGYGYVPWALSELETVRRTLVAKPRALDLGLPLEVTDAIERDQKI